MEKFAKCILVVVVLGMFLVWSGTGRLRAAESDFPSKPITIYITYAPGGSTDLSVRALAEAASRILGQPIICVNKPGALGAVAISELLTKKPDGYTLSCIGYGLVTVVPHMRTLPFNPLEDLVHVMSFANYVYALGVRTEAPWKTWEEFRDYSKKNPGKVSYGVSSVGNPVHIAMEQLAQFEEIKWKVITYKGGAECIMAALGGHVDAATPTSEFVPHVKANKFRLLLIMSPGRVQAFPEVPTITEKGYKFSALSGISFCAPKGLPEGIRKKLEEAFKKAMEDAKFKSVLEELQMVPQFCSGPALVEMWKADFPVMGEVLKKMALTKEKEK
jgi:tripartite-type tricarboxylate transporter receptor subunit TctC